MLVVLMVSGLVGFGFGFAKWFGVWVYLPWIPNALDSIFICVSALVLGKWAWRDGNEKS